MGVGSQTRARLRLLLDDVMVRNPGFTVSWIAKLEGAAPTVAQVEATRGALRFGRRRVRSDAQA